MKFVPGGTIDGPPRARAKFSFHPFLEPLEPRTVLNAFPVASAPAIGAAPRWEPVGPAPIKYATDVIAPGMTYPDYTPLRSAQDVGAVNALAVAPHDPAHVYAATVNGGIWETKNYTAARPFWTTTTDLLPSLAISAIAISPANDRVIYAGTGNYSSAAGGDVFGPGQGDNAAGIYKSTNGGVTWTVLNPNGIFDGLRIRRVVPTSLNGGLTVFAATTDTAVHNGAVDRGGVYRSDDGGTSWTRLSGSGNLPNTGVTDLAANPANPKQIFAAIAGQAGGDSPGYAPNPVPAGSSGIYRLDLSAPNPTWTKITDGAISTAIRDAIRVELSLSKSGDNPLWVTTIATIDDTYTQYCYSGAFRAPNAPTPAWSAVGAPDVLQEFIGDGKGCMLADPRDANFLYVGGDLRSYTPFTAYVARYNYTDNTWTSITPNSPTFATVTQVKRLGGVATLTATHSFFVGQEVVVAGLSDATLNGRFKVTAATGTTFSYASAGPDVAPTSNHGTATLADSPSLADIRDIERHGNVATVTAAQEFVVGESVVVAGLSDASFNGTFQITAVTDTSFSYASPGPNVVHTSADGMATLVAFGPGTVEPIQTGVATGPHPDTRGFQFGVGGDLLLACDGGVYKCVNPRGAGAEVVWSSVNGTLQNTELYQVALDNRGNTNPADDLILGAAMDNGGSERTPHGRKGAWVERVGGDGVVVLADPTSDTRYVSSEDYFVLTVTGADTIAYPPGTVAGTGGKYLNTAAGNDLAEDLPFNVMFRLNQGDIANGANPARVLLAGDETLYLSNDKTATYASIGGVSGTTPQPVNNCSYDVVTAIAFGCAQNPNAAYVAGYKTDSGGAIIPNSVGISFTDDVTAAGGGFNVTGFTADGPVWDITIDPNDAKTAYVVTDSKVFMTTNGGVNWTAITDNLESLVNPHVYNQYYFANARGIALFDNGTATKADDWVLAGEPGGVFRRMVQPPAAAGTDTWQAFGAGSTLPNTLVTSLIYDSKSDVLLAGTFGRGAWLLKNASAVLNTAVYNGSLFVMGTNGDDRIRIVPDWFDWNAVRVIVNGKNLGVFNGITGQIVVNTLGGHDHVNVARGVHFPVIVNGVELDRGMHGAPRDHLVTQHFGRAADHILVDYDGLEDLLPACADRRFGTKQSDKNQPKSATLPLSSPKASQAGKVDAKARAAVPTAQALARQALGDHSKHKKSY